MPKKSFKESNPALQFISSAATALQEEPAPTPERAAPSATPAARKPTPTPPKRGGAETKSKRLNLLLQPSVLDDLSKIACMQQTSVNDLINRVLREHRDGQLLLIQRYDEVFGDN